MIAAAKPARLAAAARIPGAAKTTNGALGVRLRQAASASSGPIPAGSPMVIASGGMSSVMLKAPRAASPGRTARRSEADVRLHIAKRAQHELNHQRLVARRRVHNDRTARECGEGLRLADARRISEGECRAVVLVADAKRIADRIGDRGRLSQGVIGVTRHVDHERSVGRPAIQKTVANDPPQALAWK